MEQRSPAHTPASGEQQPGTLSPTAVAAIAEQLTTTLGEQLEQRLAERLGANADVQSVLGDQFNEIRERLEHLEIAEIDRRTGTRYDSERSGGRKESKDGSEESLSDETGSESASTDDSQLFLEFDRKTTKHWGTGTLADEGKYKPDRFPLYGWEPWNNLTNNGKDTKGTLAQTLSYLHPLVLYLAVNLAGAEQILRAFDAGVEPERDLLLALVNNLRETHALGNRARSLVLLKEKAMRPGATEHHKARAAAVEDALGERDLADPDLDGEVGVAARRFDRQLTKEKLKSLATKAARSGGGGGGGYGGHSDDEDDGGGKTRSKKRRDRAKAAKQKHGGGDGGGKSRSSRDGKRSSGGGTSRDDAKRSSGGGTSRDDAKRGRREQQRGGRDDRRADKSSERSKSTRGGKGGGGSGGGSRDGKGAEHAKQSAAKRSGKQRAAQSSGSEGGKSDSESD